MSHEVNQCWCVAVEYNLKNKRNMDIEYSLNILSDFLEILKHSFWQSEKHIYFKKDNF